MPIQGLTLIELMVTLSILGLILVAALPSLSTWSRNTQIRTAAESLQNGLTKARNEAIRRNQRTRMSLVTSLASTCELSSSSALWIVSLQDPVGACANATGASATPMIIEKATPGEAASNVTITVKAPSSTDPCGNTSTATFAEFDGFGRMTGPSTQIRCLAVTHSQGSGNRDLNIVLSGGGQIRVCDPAVSSTSDPRKC